MIKKREAAMAGEIDGYGSDFLGQLVKVYRSADMTSRITIDDLIDECKNFYIAGHETTTSALTWIVLMLATHADWQEKVRNEILELFGQQNPSLEGISRLKTVSEINRYSLESNEIYQQLFAIRSCSNYNMIDFVFNLFSCR
jgi:PHYB activation tagged suppressor 1